MDERALALMRNCGRGCATCANGRENRLKGSGSGDETSFLLIQHELKGKSIVKFVCALFYKDICCGNGYNVSVTMCTACTATAGCI